MYSVINYIIYTNEGEPIRSHAAISEPAIFVAYNTKKYIQKTQRAKDIEILDVFPIDEDEYRNLRYDNPTVDEIIRLQEDDYARYPF